MNGKKADSSKKHTTNQRPDQEGSSSSIREKVFYFLPTGSFLDTYVFFSFLSLTFTNSKQKLSIVRELGDWISNTQGGAGCTRPVVTLNILILIYHRFIANTHQQPASRKSKPFTTLSKNKMTPHLCFRAQVPFHCPQHTQYLKV